MQYFNYKNFTNPQYINYTKGIPLDGGKYSAPSAVVYNPSDEALNGSWLRLVPGQSGKIDLSVNFVKYGKIHPTDIEQSILGIYAQNIASYYIMNVSDDKPKFVISRQPFSSVSMPTADDNGNYELES